VAFVTFDEMRTQLLRRAAAAIAATACVATAALPAMSSATTGPQSTTYTVTNTSGDERVPGSLPWALFQANYVTKGFDRIHFNIPGPGPHEIKVTSTLFVVDQVDINARTQPGYNGEPLIWVTGGPNTPSLFLLTNHPETGVTSSGSGVQGFGLYRYTNNGVTIFPTSEGNWIQYNWIGFRPTPQGVLLNTSSGLPGATSMSIGVGIISSHNAVRFNVISGTENGIVIGGADRPPAVMYRGNSVSWNMIGTDPTGTTVAGYGNTGDGIFMGHGSEGTWVGPDNVFSGNASAGIEMLFSSSWGSIIFRNKVGVDVTGTKRLGNGELGILVGGRAHTVAIGGPWGGNIVAGNRLGGIAVGVQPWGPSNDVWIANNLVGVNINGEPLGDQRVGISINHGSTRTAAYDNVIGGHSEHGVLVGSPNVSTTRGNSVHNNWIGRDQAGKLIPNGAFGVYFLNAPSNWVTGNQFGWNLRGNLGAQRSPNLVIR
jgi:hypothetical protein